MSTDTSTIPTNSDAQALALVHEAVRRGCEHIAATAAKAAAELDEQDAIRATEWAALDAKLPIPDWMRQYLDQPAQHEEAAGCTSRRLLLPACSPIDIERTAPHWDWNQAECRPIVPTELKHDDEWWVHWRYGARYPIALLDVCIAVAESNGREWHELTLEAQRRNDLQLRPAPEPQPAPTVAVEMPDDPAAKVLAHIGELNYSNDDLIVAARGLLYGIVTIAKELRSNTHAVRGEIAALRGELAAVRVAVEDIAAAALCDELTDPEQDNVN